jgi:hypothetical protein
MDKKLAIIYLIFTFSVNIAEGCHGESNPSKNYKKVFVLGNSLTIGFGTHGMASSDVNTDYYYWLQQTLSSKNGELVMRRFSGALWESGSNGTEDGLSERRLSFLDSTVSKNIDGSEDLIIVQLGDNVNTSDKKKHFKEDAVVLINWFKSKCPDAKILWVYGWYNFTSNMPLLKDAIVEAGGCDLVDISKFATDEKYKSKIGNKYIDRNGNIMEITSTGVASHPGDLGMEMIANLILDALQIK